jgi:hypothetical protein
VLRGATRRVGAYYVGLSKFSWTDKEYHASGESTGPCDIDTLASTGDVGKAPSVDDIAFKAGQLWTYQTRKHEPKSRILVQRVELDPKEIVHIRILNLAFKGPKGTITEIPHLPYSGSSLRKCLVALESSGNRVPSDYEAGYKIWREAFDSGKGGIFTLDVAGVLDGMEKATAQ